MKKIVREEREERTRQKFQKYIIDLLKEDHPKEEEN